MSYSLPIKNGILTMCRTTYICPICTFKSDGENEMEKIAKSKTGHIRHKCNGCKRFIGICTDITGDIVVYELGVKKLA